MLQFNDALLYTTPVQSGMYKLNNMLSLAGMKVSHLLKWVFLQTYLNSGLQIFIAQLCLSLETDIKDACVTEVSYRLNLSCIISSVGFAA